MNVQQQFRFQPGAESKRARCRRLLAGVPKITTAAKLFTPAAQREAERRCQQSNQRTKASKP